MKAELKPVMIICGVCGGPITWAGFIGAPMSVAPCPVCSEERYRMNDVLVKTISMVEREIKDMRTMIQTFSDTCTCRCGECAACELVAYAEENRDDEVKP